MTEPITATRRDVLVAMLTAMFLALFPWLRDGKGPEVARLMAEVSAHPKAGEIVVYVRGIAGASKLSFYIPVKEYNEIRDSLGRHAANPVQYWPPGHPNWS